MNRRDFVRRVVAGLAGTAVAAEFDLERLLWIPKPMIVVPALPGGVTVTWERGGVLLGEYGSLRDALAAIDAEAPLTGPTHYIWCSGGVDA